MVDKPTEQPPNTSVIVYSTAHVLTSNIGDKGTGGIIFAVAYGYCFPRIRPRFAYHSGADFQLIYEWKCVPFGFSAFYQVSSHTNFEPFIARAFGGVDCDLNAVKDDLAFLTGFLAGYDTDRPVTSAFELRHVELLPTFENVDSADNVFLPVGEGFYRMDKFGRLTFYDSEKNTVAENIPVHKDFFHVEIGHGEFEDTYRFNNKPSLNGKIYTSDGKVEDATIVLDSHKIANDDKAYIYLKNINVPPTDGYYIKYSTWILEPLQFTPQSEDGFDETDLEEVFTD